MICPYCKTNGDRSVVEYNGSRGAFGTSTRVFYDEDGRGHRHKWTDAIDNYTCSRGHYFEILSEVPPCWCEVKE